MFYLHYCTYKIKTSDFGGFDSIRCRGRRLLLPGLSLVRFCERGHICSSISDSVAAYEEIMRRRSAVAHRLGSTRKSDLTKMSAYGIVQHGKKPQKLYLIERGVKHAMSALPSGDQRREQILQFLRETYSAGGVLCQMRGEAPARKSFLPPLRRGGKRRARA